jgi:hypothetical protein
MKSIEERKRLYGKKKEKEATEYFPEDQNLKTSIK